MDALDYSRDNRLRLWFLGVDYKSIKDVEIRRVSTFEKDMTKVMQIMTKVVKANGACVLVLGDVSHSDDRNYDVPQMVIDLVKDRVKTLHLEEKWVEDLPDHRRSIRKGRATKKETVLVFRKIGR